MTFAREKAARQIAEYLHNAASGAFLSHRPTDGLLKKSSWLSFLLARESRSLQKPKENADSWSPWAARNGQRMEFFNKMLIYLTSKSDLLFPLPNAIGPEFALL